MNVGITGHQQLRNPASWGWVGDRLEEAIAKSGPQLTGVSSLAVGADQLFAALVLKRGGRLYAVLPFAGYETTFAEEEHELEYRRLLSLTARVEIMPPLQTEELSYLAAGKRVIDLSDIVVAVWDGRAAAGVGGTGDAVQYAIDVRKTVVHIDPYGRLVRILTT
ncbi:MAG: hypothetical protein ACJ74Q_26305 [Pyrinomonadaceae bacterium]